MAHYGPLRNYRFSDDVDDIRGASLYGYTGNWGRLATSSSIMRPARLNTQ